MYTSDKFSKKLAEAGCKLKSEQMWVKYEFWKEAKLWVSDLNTVFKTVCLSGQREYEHPAYDILNDICVKYAQEFFGCEFDCYDDFEGNDHSCDDKCEMNKRLEWEHRAVEILRLLQSNKINEAENYIWRYCKFNKPNDKKNIHKIYVEL